mgnify:CR=1 FL=1
MIIKEIRKFANEKGDIKVIIEEINDNLSIAISNTGSIIKKEDIAIISSIIYIILV